MAPFIYDSKKRSVRCLHHENIYLFNQSSSTPPSYHSSALAFAFRATAENAASFCSCDVALSARLPPSGVWFCAPALQRARRYPSTTFRNETWSAATLLHTRPGAKTYSANSVNTSRAKPKALTLPDDCARPRHIREEALAT